MFFGRYPYNLEKDKLIPIEKNMYFYSSSLSGMCKTAIKGLLEPVYLERVLLTNDSPLYSWLAYNMTIIQEPDGKLTTERKTHLYYLNEPTIKNKLSNSNNSSSHLTKTNSNFKLTVTNLGSDNSKGATNKDLRPSLPNINNRNNTLYKITSNHNSKSNIFNSGSKKQQTSYISRIANNLSNNENTESHIALTDRNINYKEKSEKSGKSDNEISSKSIIPDISKDKIEKNIKEYLNTELNLELGKTIFKPSSLLGKADKAYNKNSKSTKKLIFK